MNMIDMYLKINSCERDRNDNIYQISETNEKVLLGKIKDYRINTNTGKLVLHIDKFQESVSFLQILTIETVVDSK